MARAAERDRQHGLFGQRHRTAREAVFESQRGRMLDAMVLAVADKGYAATTIGDVVARARVSRRTFYEQFADKEECFVAALDAGFDFVFERIAAEFARLDRRDWRSHVEVAVTTYLATVASEPEFSRVVHLDALAASERSRERFSGVLQRFVDFYNAQNEIARAEDSSIPEIDQGVMLAMVAGIADVAREHLARGEQDRLPAFATPLVGFAQGVIAGEWRATPQRKRSRTRASRRAA